VFDPARTIELRGQADHHRPSGDRGELRHVSVGYTAAADYISIGRGRARQRISASTAAGGVQTAPGVGGGVR
jgi:hypothetical protein